MDDRLRHEIRAAFERDQAAHPPAANLRQTVVRSVATRPVRQVNLQWVAVAAAVMIAVLVVVSLVASRLHLSGPINSHKPTVGEPPVGEPPAGVNLLYVADLGADGTLNAYDWNGKAQGKLNFRPQQTGLMMAPDGQEFVSGYGAKGGNFEFFDRLGISLGATSQPGAYGVVWADDNRSVCFMTQDPQTLTYTLWTEEPGQTAKAVSAVAKDTSLGQSVLNVVACSRVNDTALVVRTTVGWAAELWVVRLSDGHEVAHHTYADETLGSVVASPDARYIAETSSMANASTLGPHAPYSVIRRVSDWAVIAKMDAGYVVLGFSGDGGSVLVRTQVTSHGMNYAIFTWGTDGTLRTVWQYLNPGMTIASSTSEPGGSSFAIAFIALDSNNRAEWCPPASAFCNTALTVTIVHGDGSTVDIPGRYNTAW